MALRETDTNPGMEFLSMSHSRDSTEHLCPQVGDTLLTNLRLPILTVVEDTSPGTHDTLMAACDPLRYKELGVEDWEQHGSCAENLVLSLQQLNKQVGLKGRKAIGCDVTVNNVPSPLNLFMNVPWNNEGKISFGAPKGKRGDYIRFRAERDMIIVMSACPQDVTEINGKKPMVAHFVVESPVDEKSKLSNQKDEAQKASRKINQPTESRKLQPAIQLKSLNQSSGRSRSAVTPEAPRRPPPRKLNSDRSTTSTATPYKETQRVELSPLGGNTPRAARNKPRKLERRGTSSGVIPRA
jgi:uncharacterized protein YcgI (DUF1989 family)